MPGKLIAAHHSITDWDFEQGDTARELDHSTYVSAPTSLHFDSNPTVETNGILCRIPATMCLPQGELRTWIRANTDKVGPTPGTFRNQAALGSADIVDCYMFYWQYDLLGFYRIVNGYSTALHTFDFPRDNFVWYHTRVFWYNGKTPAEEDALCVDLYREVAGEWIKQEPTVYDTVNKFKDSDINRCGPFCYLRSGVESWFDDTEIWGPV